MLINNLYCNFLPANPQYFFNMGWAWKELDFEVRTKDTKVRVPDRDEGNVLIIGGKLCIPDDYELASLGF